MTIRVQLIDNLAMVQAGLRAFLGCAPDLELAAVHTCSAQCGQECASPRPEVLILALSEEDRCNLDCVDRIRKRFPDIHILVLADHEDIVLAARALRLGVMGFVSKSSPGPVLLEAVRSLAGGRSYIDAPVAQRMADALVTGEHDPFEALSRREYEIFAMLARSASRKQIAERLYLSVKTVSNHRAHIMKKLCIRNHSELLRLAIRHGIVEA